MSSGGAVDAQVAGMAIEVRLSGGQRRRLPLCQSEPRERGTSLSCATVGKTSESGFSCPLISREATLWKPYSGSDSL